MTPPPRFLTVVIPVLDGGASFERCLDALSASSFRDWEAVVVDDGSSDRSAAVARARGARVAATAGRQGPAAARNTGVRLASGECLLFLDADCAVHSDTLERVVAILQSEERVDAVFGSYDDRPAAPGLVSRYRNLLHHWTHQRGGGEATTFWAGCGAVRRTAFESIGGFDAERYRRPSIEDIDFGVRLRARGGRILLAPEVQVQHLKRWTLLDALRTDALARAGPWSELALRSRILPRQLNVNLSGRASVAATWGALACLAAAPWWPWSLAMGTVLLGAVAVINLPFYRFLARRGGTTFALASFALHVLHFLAAGLGLAIGVFRYLGSRRSRAIDLPLEDGA